MTGMIFHRRAMLLLLLSLSVASFCKSSPSSSPLQNNADIQMAIERSRHHLQHNTPKHAPYAFPNTRYRLALMLESLLDSSSSKEDVAEECIDLYQNAAANTTNTPPLTRITALHRAATLMLQYNDNDDQDSSSAAESLLWQALEIESDNEQKEEMASILASVFETLIRLLLTRTSVVSSQQDELEILESALELCQSCLIKCPEEPVTDEYMGVILRKLNGRGIGRSDETRASSSAAALEVYRCYEQAAIKSHNAASRASFPQLMEDKGIPLYGSLPISTTTNPDDASLGLWNRLVRHVILAACSAREAGLVALEQDHFDYGLAILTQFGHVIDPDIQADLYTNIGIRYKRMLDLEKASEYFDKALETHPHDGHALVQLASIDKLSSTRHVDKLDESYVAGLFDGYSDRFEHELVEELHYKGHILVADALFSQKEWLRVNDNGVLVVVDLGCGTGLLGALLRKRLSETVQTCKSDNINDSIAIYGVDLSPRMATMSRTRDIKDEGQQIRVYDEVRVSDALEFLESMTRNSVNAITASDVFIYVGALDSIFEECARVLFYGGLLCFTVELPTTKGVTLLKSGRFGHSKDYISQVARKAGMEMLEWKEEVLRKQGGQDVRGAVATLMKRK